MLFPLYTRAITRRGHEDAVHASSGLCLKAQRVRTVLEVGQRHRAASNEDGEAVGCRQSAVGLKQATTG
jgi:hypothetical protein